MGLTGNSVEGWQPLRTLGASLDRRILDISFSLVPAFRAPGPGTTGDQNVKWSEISVTETDGLPVLNDSSARYSSFPRRIRPENLLVFSRSPNIGGADAGQDQGSL